MNLFGSWYHSTCDKFLCLLQKNYIQLSSSTFSCKSAKLHCFLSLENCVTLKLCPVLIVFLKRIKANWKLWSAQLSSHLMWSPIYQWLLKYLLQVVIAISRNTWAHGQENHTLIHRGHANDRASKDSLLDFNCIHGISTTYRKEDWFNFWTQARKKLNSFIIAPILQPFQPTPLGLCININSCIIDPMKAFETCYFLFVSE